MVFWNSCSFDDPANVCNLISGSSAFSKSSLNIWKFMVHELLKPGLENFEHYFSVWDECNCGVVWAFFGDGFLWDWNENWPFPVLWPWLSFSKFAGILSAALSQHHLSGFEIAQLEFHHLIYINLFFFWFFSTIGDSFVTLYRRQWSRPSPRKRNVKRSSGCLGKP